MVPLLGTIPAHTCLTRHSGNTLKRGSLKKPPTFHWISATWPDLAAEDSSESMAIAAGALGGRSPNAKVLSYEAPFGVGYLVARLA